jgi:RNA polymerase sigma-70 factor (ECF subfamily)
MGLAELKAASAPELMSLVAAGDPAAFEVLMRSHNQRLFRTARSIVRDDAEAEDIVQEAYLAAYRNAASFRGEASLSTWLTRIVVNEANGRLRRQQRRDGIVRLVPESEEQAMEERPSPDTPDEAALRLEARRLIEARIDALPERLRIVFVLRAVEDLSVGETAAALGIPEATVRSQFFRARAMLRDALARDFDDAAAFAFAFDGARCDRIVAAVLARL